MEIAILKWNHADISKVLKVTCYIFQAEDEQQKEKIGAKNSLESYCFNMKTTIDDEKLKEKIGETDRKLILDKCEETIKWLDANQLAEVNCLPYCSLFLFPSILTEDGGHFKRGLTL